MSDTTFGIIFLVIITVITLTLTWMIPIWLKRLTSRFRKSRPVKRLTSPLQPVSAGEHAALANLEKHMDYFNINVSDQISPKSDRFVREVYYPTFQLFDEDLTRDFMVTHLEQHQRKITTLLKAYRLEDVETLADGLIAYRVTRQYDDKTVDQIRYVLAKEPSGAGWSLEHILRTFEGRFINRKQTDEGHYLLEIELGSEEHPESRLLFLTKKNQFTFQPGTQVTVEGYLEVNKTLNGQIYYELIAIRSMQY